MEEELLLRNEYLVVENRLLRNQIEGRLQLTGAEHQTLAEIGKKLGKQALEEIATIVKSDTILAWHRKLMNQKFDGSKQRQSLGRPRVDKELEDWVVKMAKENRTRLMEAYGARTCAGIPPSRSTLFVSGVVGQCG